MFFDNVFHLPVARMKLGNESNNVGISLGNTMGNVVVSLYLEYAAFNNICLRAFFIKFGFKSCAMILIV